MTDRPIIFSAPMVRGLIREIEHPGTGKTETSRLAWEKGGKPSPWLKLHDKFNYKPIKGHPAYMAGRDGVIYRIVSPFRYRPLQAATVSKYPNVILSTGGVSYTKNVHRLVCEAWYGPPPTSDHEARHLDSDRMNSVVDNLDWALPQDNWTDRNSLGRGVREEHHSAKLKPAQILEFRASKESQRALTSRYGLAQATIWEIKTGRTWADPSNPAPLLMPRPENPKLWVREAFRLRRHQDHNPPSQDWWKAGATYAADGSEPTGCEGGPGKLRRSIHMPRWASRLTLVVTAARVERLQEITRTDAEAEGFSRHPADDAICDFSELWEELHGPGAWDDNPEVVPITFTVHRRNIDAESPP